jgi:hypothetical protein
MFNAHRSRTVGSCSDIEGVWVRIDHAVKRRATLAMTGGAVSRDSCVLEGDNGHTVQGYDAEDEDDGQSHDNDGVNLETGGLISVQPWNLLLALVQFQAM